MLLGVFSQGLGGLCITLLLPGRLPIAIEIPTERTTGGHRSAQRVLPAKNQQSKEDENGSDRSLILRIFLRMPSKQRRQ